MTTARTPQPDRVLLALDLPADPESVGTARAQLVALARGRGAGGEALQQVALAVSEAVTNAVRHAYDEAASGRVVRIRACEADQGGLVVSVADDGRGLRVQSRSPGMGLGLVIMEASAEHFAVSSSEQGTQVALTFAF